MAPTNAPAPAASPGEATRGAMSPGEATRGAVGGAEPAGGGGGGRSADPACAAAGARMAAVCPIGMLILTPAVVVAGSAC
mmetsp:Transcript_30816/g.71241  ORF Transcript_30816/g.71241 Transcript_30816/m.71241 type:complete len:80 (-) Transcript_30816:314-553(-)